MLDRRERSLDEFYCSAPLVRLAVTERFDYEDNLAIVIGRNGPNISQANVLQSVSICRSAIDRLP